MDNRLVIEVHHTLPRQEMVTTSGQTIVVIGPMSPGTNISEQHKTPSTEEKVETKAS